MQHRALPIIFSGFLGLLASLPAQADEIAYTDPSDQGTQAFTGNLALDFTVNAPIAVTALGVFNALGNGVITGPIQVAIFQSGSLTPKTEFTFAGTYATGGLGFDVFQKPLSTPVVLGPGNYEVDAVGFSASDLNGNLNTGSSTGPTLDNGGGLLTFTGASWDYSTSLDNPATCPNCVAGSQQSVQFDAGTFKYTSMDEAPGITELILTMGLAGLALVWARKRMAPRVPRATQTYL